MNLNRPVFSTTNQSGGGADFAMSSLHVNY